MKNRYIYAALTYMLVPIAGMSTDIYLPSLPSMVQQFDVNKSYVQNTITAFVLAMGIGQLLAGPICDALGRKKLIQFALGVQLVAILGIIFSSTMSEVIMLRFLQGLGAAFMVVPARAVLNDIFSPEELKKHYNYLTISFAIGPIIAPFIGGYMQQFVGWHGSFWFLFTLEILGILLASFVLKETIRQTNPFSLGSMFSNYITILSNPKFRNFCLFTCLLFAYSYVFNVTGPFIFQTLMHMSPVTYGYIALCAGGSWFAGNIINRFLLHVDPFQKIRFGLNCTSVIITVFLILSLTTKVSWWMYAIPCYLLIFCSALIFPNMVAASLNLFPKLAASANACFFAITWVFVSIYTTIASGLKAHTVLPVVLTFVIFNILSQVVARFKVL